jgi:nitroreductase
MTDLETLKKIISGRRTTKAAAMNGKKIPDEQVEELLRLADWAPTHGRTEPWRFFVYSGDALKKFGWEHAELYLSDTPEDKLNEETPGKLMAATENPSHLVIAVMKRGDNPKIPAIEEIAAASAAVQNMLLGAEASGISAIWNTGGMSHKKVLKDHLGLAEQDIVLGLIYMGYTDEPKREGTRKTPLEDKVKWRR